MALSYSMHLRRTGLHSTPHALTSPTAHDTTTYVPLHMCWSCPLARPTVGNKDDDPEKKVVLLEEAQRFAKQIGIPLYETSAKENKNVEEVRSVWVVAQWV